MDVDVSLQSGCVYFTIGITIFTSLFFGLEYTLRTVIGVSEGGDIGTKKCKLPYFALLEICNHLVSLIQSLAASFVGIHIVSSCFKDVMYERNWLCNRYAWVMVSYLTYDTTCMYLVHNYKHKQSLMTKPHTERMFSFLRENLMMMIHHIALPLVLFPVVLFLRRGLGDFFLGCFYLLELSTPFTNLRCILSMLGYKSSKIYIINGLLMIFAFAFCRVFIFFFMFWAYGFQYNKSIFEVMLYIPIQCKLGCIVVLIPQLYWLSQMVKGAAKLFSKMGQHKQD